MRCIVRMSESDKSDTLMNLYDFNVEDAPRPVSPDYLEPNPIQYTSRIHSKIDAADDGGRSASVHEIAYGNLDSLKGHLSDSSFEVDIRNNEYYDCNIEKCGKPYFARSLSSRLEGFVHSEPILPPIPRGTLTKMDVVDDDERKVSGGYFQQAMTRDGSVDSFQEPLNEIKIEKVVLRDLLSKSKHSVQKSPENAGRIHSELDVDYEERSTLSRDYAIHELARDGDFDSLQGLLNDLETIKLASEMNIPDENHLTPLHYAALYNRTHITQLLLQNGANPNEVDEDGLTPLHFAARYVCKTFPRYSSVSSADSCKTVICQLLEAGAWVNSQDKYGLTPLHYAAMRRNTTAARELLKWTTIEIEARDQQSMTPLHYAAIYNSPEIVELLLNAKADPEASNQKESSPLHLAAASGNKDIALLLLNDVETRKGLGGLKSYIGEKNANGRSAFLLAVIKGQLEVVKVLLEKGADVKAYSQSLHLSVVSGNVEVVRCLLQHGAEINRVNWSKETPLHKAVSFGADEIVDLLLENEADVDCYDKSHRTPLMIAAAGGHIKIAEKLLRAGAKAEEGDNMDRDAVYWAAKENHPEALEILLDDPNAYDLVNTCDLYNSSPLHVAALKGYTDIAKILLHYEAETKQKDQHHFTPLHLAAKEGHLM